MRYRVFMIATATASLTSIYLAYHKSRSDIPIKQRAPWARPVLLTLLLRSVHKTSNLKSNSIEAHMKSSTPVSVQRRQFLQALAGTSLAGWAGLASHSSHAATADQAWRSSYAPFDSAPGSNPTATTLQTERLTLIGRPPKALRGNFYRIGPARFVRAENRLNHWFDGDGMVQLFRIDGAQVSHLGHLLDTPKSHQGTASQTLFIQRLWVATAVSARYATAR